MGELLSALLVGLLGSGHCAAMCGGVVSALTVGLPETHTTQHVTRYLLLYNLARITSYALAGALVASLGQAILLVPAWQWGQQLLQLLAAVMLVLMACYIAGWWYGLRQVERLGGVIWRRLQPLAQRVIPIRSYGQAGLAGLLWGWLPCGLVYSVLVWCLSAGSALEGALLMLAFGLGTWPSMLLLGHFAQQLRQGLNRPWVRQYAGMGLLGFALWQGYHALYT